MRAATGSFYKEQCHYSKKCGVNRRILVRDKPLLAHFKGVLSWVQRYRGNYIDIYEFHC